MTAPRAAAPTCNAERARIVEALVDLVARLGYEQTTLAMVLERAGVEEQVFHRYFVDVEDCFCEVLEEMNGELARRSLVAFEGKQGWLNQMRAMGYAIFDFLTEDPRRARLLYVDMLSLGDRAQIIRDESLSSFIELVDRGRQELDDPDSVSRATAEGVAGAVYYRIHATVVQNKLDGLSDLVPQLMYLAVLPYVGTAAALTELHRSPPEKEQA
jgi:AcrR family transcriptional regulator